MCLVPSKPVSMFDQEDMISTGTSSFFHRYLIVLAFRDHTTVLQFDNFEIVCSIPAGKLQL
jgi:hypothetical protein